jgi:hypothetical protein
MARVLLSHGGMQNLHSLPAVLLAWCISLAACGGTDPGPSGQQVDATVPDTDSASAGPCTDESFQLHGAIELVTDSAGTSTSDGKIAGVAGRSSPGRFYSFNARSILATLDTVGTYDVSTVNLKYFEQPMGGCGDGTCVGFYAMAGTYEVTSTQPMYRATFTLSDLRERSEAGSTPGPSMQGTITGCVSAVPI